ncbi:MAG: xylulokinase [Akkermansiaceae bacterium]
MSITLGIDVSTQGVSAVVLDSSEAVILADASVNFGKDLPEYKAPQGFIPSGAGGEVHADPRMWLDGLELCIERLSASGYPLNKIDSISGAGQQHGTVYLNDQWFDSVKTLQADHSLSSQLAASLSRKTSPIWMDGTTAQECQEITAVLGGESEVCRRSGSIAIERFSGPQIRRFAKNSPDGYAATERIHLVSSFLASVMIGADAPIDHGDGAGMNLMNLESLSWDNDLVQATASGLENRLPALVSSESIIGVVSPYFVKRFGFRQDIPVVAFTGDNPSSLVGMGASQQGKIVISLGTSDTLFSAFDQPRTDPNGYGHVFGNTQAGYMALVCFRNGSLARERVKDQLDADWSIFDLETLSQTPAGNNGNMMLPFYEDEITPRLEMNEPLLKGTELFESWQDAPALARACLEGQFTNMWLHARWMGVEADTVYLTGGASVNHGIAQVLANVFQAKVQRIEVSGSVALGAAIRAVVACAVDLHAVTEAFFAQQTPRVTLPEEGTSNAYCVLRNQYSEWLEEL